MIYRLTSLFQNRLGSPARERGQSLVELAIVFPLLLVLFLGLAEVGAVLHSHQIVVNAAREGARYGAKSLYTPEENIAAWTRQSANALKVTVVVDDVPQLNAEKATIIVTRLRKVYSGGGFTFEVIETYTEGGDRPTILTEEWFATQADKSGDLTAADWPDGVPVQAMDLIAVEMMYDHPHLTGFFDIGNISRTVFPNPIPLHSMTVMRVGGSRIPSCDAYPIAVRDTRIAGLDEDDSWQGDIYEGGGAGEFGWLRWPDSQGGDANYLADMLTNPGLSRRDFDSATNPDDHWLNSGDDVYGNTGISNSDAIRDAMAALVGEKIRVPVWDSYTDGHYHIIGFVWIEIISYDLPPGHGGSITAYFRGWDETCTAAE